MESVNIYLLAGLGFDQRIFENLIFEIGKVHYLTWLEPNKNESLDNYVSRISNQINKSDENIILIGHSFGGVIVQEISKLVNPKKVILISSIKSVDEKPFSLKCFKIFPIYKLLNKKLVLGSFPIWARIFGYNSEKGRALFNQMIGNSSDNYLKWSLEKITNWEGANIKCELHHIHGTRDFTFPIHKIKAPKIIKDGSHFMVFSKAEEVSKILNEII